VSGGVSYQWYFNGFALSGETNATLGFASVQSGASGSYYLVAANAAGSVTSAVSSVAIGGLDYEVIHWFGTNGLDGVNGWGPLVLDTNGWLYGCARNGAISNAGVVFKVQTNGLNYTVLHRFQPATNGANPSGGLILASDGALYGTCQIGGTNNAGTVFRLNRDGSNFAVLHHFLSFGDCRNPQAELLEASDGRLYGTAYSGGGFGPGGVFRLNKDGTGYQVLYGFRATNNDGQGPLGGLIEALDGLLYGTTEFGGQSNKGTIFRIAKAGTNYARIKDLGLVSGGAANPLGTLLQAGDGLLYGTSYSGGASNAGAIFKVETNGANFAFVHSLDSAADEASEPRAGLVSAPDGSLLGTTRVGGIANQGAIYRVRTNGVPTYETVHHFTGRAGDGARSRSPLVRTPNGIYYGTTFSGGTNDQGVIFRIAVP
jgi:uncharacterized repeat protein (TIGR03803 family)